LKFTNDAILNLDAKFQMIKNEKKLSEIEEVTVIKSQPEIYLRFVDNKQDTNWNWIQKLKEDPLDLIFRKYICDSMEVCINNLLQIEPNSKPPTHTTQKHTCLFIMMNIWIYYFYYSNRNETKSFKVSLNEPSISTLFRSDKSLKWL
jgi:hypothetical protein